MDQGGGLLVYLFERHGEIGDAAQHPATPEPPLRLQSISLLKNGTPAAMEEPCRIVGPARQAVVEKIPEEKWPEKLAAAIKLSNSKRKGNKLVPPIQTE